MADTPRFVQLAGNAYTLYALDDAGRVWEKNLRAELDATGVLRSYAWVRVADTCYDPFAPKPQAASTEAVNG